MVLPGDVGSEHVGVARGAERSDIHFSSRSIAFAGAGRSAGAKNFRTARR